MSRVHEITHAQLNAAPELHLKTEDRSQGVREAHMSRHRIAEDLIEQVGPLLHHTSRSSTRQKIGEGLGKCTVVRFFDGFERNLGEIWRIGCDSGHALTTRVSFAGMVNDHRAWFESTLAPFDLMLPNGSHELISSGSVSIRLVVPTIELPTEFDGTAALMQEAIIRRQEIFIHH